MLLLQLLYHNDSQLFVVLARSEQCRDEDVTCVPNRACSVWQNTGTRGGNSGQAPAAKQPHAGGEGESVSAQQGCVCTAGLNPSGLLLFLWKWRKLLCTKRAEVLLERREGTLGLAKCWPGFDACWWPRAGLCHLLAVWGWLSWLLYICFLNNCFMMEQHCLRCCQLCPEKGLL